MFLRDAVTAALTVSSLIMMVSIQSIRACSCIDASDELQSCTAIELVKMTVLEQERVPDRGDSLGFVHHTVLIDEVIKTHMDLAAGMQVTLKTRRSYLPTPDLTIGLEYMLLVEPDVDESSFTELCMMQESNLEVCRHIRLLTILKKVLA